MIAAPTETRPTVVLVEDDAGLREAVQFALETEGYRVLAYASGEALLEQDLPAGPVCLVVDFHLGGMSGMEALRALRHRGARYPTIVMTTAPSPLLREWAHSTAATLIEKPLLEDVLIGAIRALA
jgi:FixJ family two-component response regulator